MLISQKWQVIIYEFKGNLKVFRNIYTKISENSFKMLENRFFKEIILKKLMKSE